jgi:hypothetical protein
MASRVSEQRRLSDARLASDDQDRALPLARVCQEPVEHFAWGPCLPSGIYNVCRDGERVSTDRFT